MAKFGFTLRSARMSNCDARGKKRCRTGTWLTDFHDTRRIETFLWNRSHVYLLNTKKRVMIFHVCGGEGFIIHVIYRQPSRSGLASSHQTRPRGFEVLRSRVATNNGAGPLRPTRHTIRSSRCVSVCSTHARWRRPVSEARWHSETREPQMWPPASANERCGAVRLSRSERRRATANEYEYGMEMPDETPWAHYRAQRKSHSRRNSYKTCFHFHLWHMEKREARSRGFELSVPEPSFPLSSHVWTCW